MKEGKTPLITVITLSYNSPDLYGAIDSVLNQTYPSIEYIILDDGTQEFDEDIIRDYINTKQHGNIEHLVVKKNNERRGIVKQTNKALILSNGQYIFNLAGDDQFADSDVLLDWVNEFIKTGAEVITAYRDVYDNNLENMLYRMPTNEEVKAIKELSPKQLFEYVEGYNIVFGCCTARNRENIKTVGLIPKEYKLIEDYVILLKQLRLNIKISFFDRVVVKYRSGGICAVDNINREYWKDSDNIFKNEVLPFSENKRRAKRKYKQWKNNVLLLQVRQKFKEEKETNGKFSGFFLYVKYAFKHPRIAVLLLKQKIDNKKKGIVYGYDLD